MHEAFEDDLQILLSIYLRRSLAGVFSSSKNYPSSYVLLVLVNDSKPCTGIIFLLLLSCFQPCCGICQR